jgi:2-desacetyl-2-hydroxyethyl bacteriochlorophyllide A dehydrogenase|uniref:Zinc-binding alcohol dehydrogenase n=1 Tax=Desulfobacca acetoxidans TaxID=60893 RepID=A0A7V6A468_9BACT
MLRHSLYFTEPYRVAVREETLLSPGPGQVLVQTLLSAISPGTELLIYRGQAPQDLPADTKIAALRGNLAFPLKYGYAAVGRVVESGQEVDPCWQDALVFAFHPHEDLFLAHPDELMAVPAGLTPEDAVFLPNLQTAITLVLDARPLIGENVVVFGQGIVGLLLTALLAHFPLGRLVTLDRHPNRRQASEMLGAHAALDPLQENLLENLSIALSSGVQDPLADLAFEVSGNPAALDQALAVTGFHGRVIIGSWYGNRISELHLGGNFHRQRQVILSSQVSTIAPELTGRWTRDRVLGAAWQMVHKIKPARFITHRFPLGQAAEAYQLLDQHPEEAIQVVLTHARP